MPAEDPAANVVLREARPADIPQMHRIRLAVRENRLTSGAITEAHYLPAIEEWGRGWVVERNGDIVGFAVGNILTGNVWALFVDPQEEGRGHGQHLHDAMVTGLWSHGFDRLWLTTEPGTRAQRFYEDAGWICTGAAERGEVRYELVRRPRG
jgi:ribosomal protein S18 acetylase RimI-like enzyme